MISFTKTTTLNRQYYYYWTSTVKKTFEASKTRPTEFRKKLSNLPNKNIITSLQLYNLFQGTKAVLLETI